MENLLHVNTSFSIGKKMRAYFLFLFLLLSFQAYSQTYELVWSDEFNGTGAPDSSKWGYELGYIRNNELQYYTNSTNNVKQNNGNLEITVIKEDAGGKQYTSGSIITLNKAAWTYGKIEGRFKMPKGKGLWACFWTLGANFPKIGWPKCGEIDIFEHINNETVVHATSHWAGADELHVSNTKSYTVDVAQWHTYSITWDANYIRWLVDDVEFHQFRITSGLNYTDEYHLPQYILINLPIGGTWPGSPDATTVLPATMYCDYVRVYKNIDTTSIPVTGFSISPTNLTMTVDGKQVINTTFVPANATNQAVTWVSGNTSVATVNKWGLVTAVGVGTTTITATTADGKTATCVVSVQNLVGVNKMVNGNFDSDTAVSQKPTGWTEWGSGAVNALTSDKAPHSPKYNGIQSSTAAFEAAVFQSLNGLANGNYTMRAWVRSSGGQSTSIMYAKNFGGAEQRYSLATSIPEWKQIQINNIKVSNNSCELGFYQWTGAPDTWIEYDDVEFFVSAVPVTGFSVSPTSVALPVGAKQVVKATIVPANATNKNVTWASSNPSVATVDTLGLVTAVGVGSATITATTADGGKTATCTVSVQSIIGLNRLVNGNFDTDKTATQTPTGWLEWGPGVANAQTTESTPHSPKYKGIQWGTAAFEVAVFQSLTGLQNGYYTMKAWVRSSGGQNYSIMYAKGYGGSERNYSLAASIPAWTQIQLDSILVTNNKCEVGFYQLTGKANKWIDYDDVEFYLTSIPVTGFSVSPDSIELALDSSQRINTTIIPYNATNQKVLWASGNTSVATVDSLGLVTAMGAGSAIITATTANGGKTASCSITVSIPVTRLTILPDSIAMALGGSQVLNTIIEPANATNQNVTWASSNTSVATVDSLGVVTAVGVGWATITGTTVDVGKTATCTVSVQDLVGVNRLVNGNFDADKLITQCPTGWTEQGVDAENAFTSKISPHSYRYNGVQFGIAAYEVAVFQSLTGLVNGNYTLKAWVRSSGRQKTSMMYAKNYGGIDQTVSLATFMPFWTQIEINNINVTNNKCEVGFYQSTGKYLTWIEYDDVEFYLEPMGSAKPIVASLKSANVTDNTQAVIYEQIVDKISIYPNPIKSGNVLNILAEGIAEFDVDIINVSGQTVYSRAGNEGGFLNIALPGLVRGLYFVKISNPHFSKVQKLLIEE